MNNFCLKQGEGLNASAAHLYLNFPSSTLPGVELHFETAYWRRYRFFYWLLLATFNIRFFMVNEELEVVTWSLSCGRLCSLQFTKSTGRASGDKWLYFTARCFATTKIVQPPEIVFCTCLRIKEFVMFINSQYKWSTSTWGKTTWQQETLRPSRLNRNLSNLKLETPNCKQQFSMKKNWW